MMYNKTIQIVALFVMATLVLGACNSGPEPTPTPASVEEAVLDAVPQIPFIGTAWMVESVGEEAEDLQPI